MPETGRENMIMPKMETMFENDEVQIRSTGRDYDFIATVENKTAHPIVVAPSEKADEEMEWFEPFAVEPGDWVGVEANDDGARFMNAVEAGNFEAGGPELFEDIDRRCGTGFEEEYSVGEELER